MTTRPVRLCSTCAFSRCEICAIFLWVDEGCTEGTESERRSISYQLFSYIQYMFSLCSEHYSNLFMLVFKQYSAMCDLPKGFKTSYHVFIRFIFSYFDKTAPCLDPKEIPWLSDIFLVFFPLTHHMSFVEECKSVFKVVGRTAKKLTKNDL